MHITKRILCGLAAAAVLWMTCGCAAPAVSPPADGSGIVLTGLFQRADGTALSDGIVQISIDEQVTEHALDAHGTVTFAQVPKCGEVAVSLPDHLPGGLLLRLSAGAVIDAVTDSQGVGHITLKEDTTELALLFVIAEDGSLQCSLQLAYMNTPNAAFLQQHAPERVTARIISLTKAQPALSCAGAERTQEAAPQRREGLQPSLCSRPLQTGRNGPGCIERKSPYADPDSGR